MNGMRMAIIGLLAWGGSLFGEEFTVMVYNVENLFDLDTVALFEDYEQDEDSGYGVEPLLNKLESIRRSLAFFNNGDGPEVILFQEFELDRTPFGSPSPERFLQSTKEQSLRELLESGRWASNLPAELLLLKYLADHGMGGYHIAQPDTFRMESHTPHKNVVFSRYPVRYVRQRPSHDARDLLVVGLDIHGHELVLLNNHWKSGASNAETEPIRVQNALVVRAELEAILLENPSADVIIGGDLNSYYNHKAVFPEIETTAVNDILGANGREASMLEPGSRNLYNLWFELPLEERGSEVWRGKWGTLMQMILTPGLYDRKGIQYIDNSFGRVVLPGENVDSRFNRPISWTNFGGGAGFSDHLPVFARFRAIPGEGEPGVLELKDPSDSELPDHQPKADFRKLNKAAIPELTLLADWDDRERAQAIGEIFRVETVLHAAGPPRIRVGDLELEIYSPIREIRDRLSELEPGSPVRMMVDLDAYRGRLQVVIRDTDWLLEP